jgi:hypothetical protein
MIRPPEVDACFKSAPSGTKTPHVAFFRPNPAVLTPNSAPFSGKFPQKSLLLHYANFRRGILVRTDSHVLYIDEPIQ